MPEPTFVLPLTDPLSVLQSAYDTGTVTDCTRAPHGLNDTYLVSTTRGRFVLRMYLYGLRTREDVLYEVDLLDHLGRAGIPVTLPIAARDGSFVQTVRGCEGARYAVLFTHAEGRDLTPSDADSYHLGGLTATLHAATDHFASRHKRFRLNLAHLLDEPLAHLAPLLKARADDWIYITSTAGRLRAQIAGSLGRSLEWGVCHGDLHNGNVLRTDNGALTLIDFDCGGPGWRTYDLAAYQCSLYWQCEELAAAGWQAFFRGYTERRPVGDTVLAAISLFVWVRQVWFMGLYARLADPGDIGAVDDGFLTRSIAFLRTWEREHMRDA